MIILDIPTNDDLKIGSDPLEIFWWVLIILFFIGSFVGIVVPLIPDAILLWGGFLIYQFILANRGLPVSFWWGMGILTTVLLLSDLLANMLVVKKYGGSKWGMFASVAGIIVGPFILGPFGFLLGPLIFVLVIEWIFHQDLSRALKVALGTLGAFFGSVVVKLIIQILMIAWFLIAV